MNEIITTLATQPSVEEWRCIREFKRRTRELADTRVSHEDLMQQLDDSYQMVRAVSDNKHKGKNRE